MAKIARVLCRIAWICSIGGLVLKSMIGFDDLESAMCIGMLVGEVIGMMIPRKDKEK